MVLAERLRSEQERAVVQVGVDQLDEVVTKWNEALKWVNSLSWGNSILMRS